MNDTPQPVGRPKRRAISKKTRFDIFKRDCFACQYCGATPPGVLLHVDHIQAVASGGSNSMDNLITACAPCNLGKGARALSVAPQALADKARETAERELQLAGFQAIFEDKRQRLIDETWRVSKALWGEDTTSVRSDDFQSVKRFVEKLGLHETLDSVDIARASRVASYKLFRYFCGVCWSKIRSAE